MYQKGVVSSRNVDETAEVKETRNIFRTAVNQFTMIEIQEFFFFIKSLGHDTYKPIHTVDYVWSDTRVKLPIRVEQCLVRVCEKILH